MNDTTTPGALVPTSAPPAEDLLLDAVLQALIVGVTGIPGPLVRPRWQQVIPVEPEVGVNWCAIGVVSVTPDDFPAVLHNPNDGLGSDTMYRHERIEVIASFFGPQGQQYAGIARDGMFLPTNNATLAPALMVFTGEVDPLRSVPELINQQWRRRYDFNAWFRRQVVRTYGVRNLVAGEIDVFTSAGEAASAIVVAH